MLGLIGVGTYNALQYLALVTTTPINLTLIAASSPVWMLAVGALVHREHPRRRQIVAPAFSLAGGPALAAFFGNLTPVFAALMSAALLGEPPRWFHALAFALIVAGIVVSSARQHS